MFHARPAFAGLDNSSSCDVITLACEIDEGKSYADGAEL